MLGQDGLYAYISMRELRYVSAAYYYALSFSRDVHAIFIYFTIFSDERHAIMPMLIYCIMPSRMRYKRRAQYA